MLHVRLAPILLAALAPHLSSQESATLPATEVPFPPSTALAESVSPEALDGLGGLVQSFVDAGEIVGAELLVIKNGRSILHEAYGLSDLAAEVPMETGSVFCVRSMTKPLIGTAILMLVDDNELEFDDRASKYLPSFDADGTREITIEQLLTHTSGLPMSLLLGQDLNELGSIRATAALGGGTPLEFEPGSDFNYSDQGTDTLAAIVEVVSGMPVAEFIQTRVLDPLGMAHSACVMDLDHPLRARALTKYGGGTGAWKPLWRPTEPPLFPFFLGSQGLYSTLEDYARFAEFWRRKGFAEGKRHLGIRYVRKALKPGPHPLRAPTGFPGLRAEYGFLMQLWMGAAEEAGDQELVAFGHTGSDGTHAWVFPEENAMVLYFTQSRGNVTGLRVEEALGELFLGVPFDPNQAAPPFEQYLGYYWEGEGDLYRAIVRDGEGLCLEILAQGVVPLAYAGDDRWKFRDNPSTVLEFQRSADGEVTGYHIGDHKEYRFEPAKTLPSAEDLAARVAKAHRLDRLETLGPMRITGKLNIEKLGIRGETEALLEWPDRVRINSSASGQSESVAFDGKTVRQRSTLVELHEVDEERSAIARVDHSLARLGDWHRWYPKMQVIQRIERGDDPENLEEIFLVRMGDTGAPARTLYVHTQGRLVREDSLTHAEGLGRIAQRLTFRDYREVSGMQWPHEVEIRLASPLIGAIDTTIESIEFGVDIAPGTFDLSDE